MYEIDVRELDDRLRTGATLIDVREPVEFAEVHVPGAKLIPMGQLPARMSEIDRSGPVYVICRSGNRSRAMVELLNANGFQAVNVAGGTQEWLRTGRPVEAR